MKWLRALWQLLTKESKYEVSDDDPAWDYVVPRDDRDLTESLDKIRRDRAPTPHD